MNKKWWKESVVYQIYPRSFYDSNNDGIGDLQGIIDKLNYLKNLGIDVIWICPIYKSPNDDNGYDISDYQEIMSEFGTMEDFDRLLIESHKRGIKLILDLVVNHTSDEHPWFIESKASLDSEKRDWYIWKKGKEGKEPNNWESIFKGSAWEYDTDTEEYYLHLFSKKQPDLNWNNKNMRNSIYKMINWWINKGIDGFRVDAISHIKKEEGLLDMKNPKELNYVPAFDKHMNVDGIHEYLKELKENTFSRENLMTVGEANGVISKDAKPWVDEKEGIFNMLFQFEHLDLWNYEKDKEFSVIKYKEILSKWQKDLEGVGWNALFVENHDIPRVVSTWGNDDKFLAESAKAIGLVYFMQQGTPFIYQGQEIGMTNVKFEKINDYNDIKSINLYKNRITEGVSKEDALKEIYSISRDNARTPMQWNDCINAGFSKVTSWIKLNTNYKDINVDTQVKDKDSVFNFYKSMIRLRKENECLVYGKYKLLLKDEKYIYAYERILEDNKFIIICNLSNNEVKINEKRINIMKKKLILANYEISKNSYEEMILRPWEARMYKK